MFSGLANSSVVGLSSKKDGKKESIILTTKHKKKSRFYMTVAMLLETGINKNADKGVKALDKVMGAGCYRRDHLDLAKVKYHKIRKSFKTRKIVLKSRRSSK